MRTLVWYRGKDLRVRDHVPLREAVAAGDVVPVFVLDPYFFAPDRAQRLPHRMQFLLEAIADLDAALTQRGSGLVLVEGRSVDILPELVERWSIDRVVAHGWTEPIGRRRDELVSKRLSIPFDRFDGETLASPGTLRSGSGAPYRVYSPFARAFLREIDVPPPMPAPRRLPPLPRECAAVRRRGTLPTLDAFGMAHNEQVIEGGETAARRRLARFLDGVAENYHEGRDRLDLAGTSRLSADLKFGTLSPHTVWHAVQAKVQNADARSSYLNELLWREFAYSILWHWPDVLQKPFRAEFEAFPWHHDDKAWQAWTTGRTGYPVVDASARQLLTEGFVHNRARMISASFLCKHLGIDYREGEAHYLRYLVDGDWAQNNCGWQWSAGCGCDAQPYFRVFNPMLQGQRFDPHGDYVRRYVPELRDIPAKWIHRPWMAPANVLAAAKVRLGGDYPHPIVDHAAARERFLALAASLRR